MELATSLQWCALDAALLAGERALFTDDQQK